MSARLASAPGRPTAKKAPARRGAGLPEIPFTGPGALPLRWLGLLLRHPVRSASLALGGVLALACLWNATMGQSAKHPAPLFGPAPAAEPARRAEMTPLPVPRPDPVTVASLAARPDPVKPDPIGGMIRSGEAARPADARPVEPRPDPDRVASAQRALSKLGYGPLKSDGLLGAGTRAAIERFERDRRLPVTGLLAGRTAKLLDAAAL